jgi:acetate kinase
MDLAKTGRVNGIDMNILVLNAGSSSLKFALFDQTVRSELAAGVVDWQGNDVEASIQVHTHGLVERRSVAKDCGYRQAVAWILQWLDDFGFYKHIRIVGHRVVHGGTDFIGPTLIDDHVKAALKRVSQLAPLHNPPALAAIEVAREALPRAQHVAVFDTAFFAGLPLRAVVYPVPYQWFEQYGIRRFGFHGISHQYCALRAANMLSREGDPDLRLVICHLGNGCSATAVRGGQPLATTMGFTPLEGLMMGTRSGSIDPGIMLHLVQQHGVPVTQLDESLNRHSGLLGVSGVSSDYRQVERAATLGNQRARLALDLFADRIRATVGALAVTLGGVDGLVFTAGIGEHSAALRSQVCEGLQCLNLLLDQRKNGESRPDHDVATTNSVGRILLIRTREEQGIAQAARELCAELI